MPFLGEFPQTLVGLTTEEAATERLGGSVTLDPRLSDFLSSPSEVGVELMNISPLGTIE